MRGVTPGRASPQSPAPSPAGVQTKGRGGHSPALAFRAPAPYQSNFMPNRAMVGGTIRLGSSNVDPLFHVMFC